MGLGLRRKSRGLANRVRAALNVGDYWYWLPDGDLPDELPIAPMIHPLRYDVLVRKALFDTYAADHRRYRDDPEAFVRRIRDHIYRRWFEQVYLTRYALDVQVDARPLEEQFADRVLRAAGLYDSIADAGFDLARPIIPFTGRTIVTDAALVPPGQRFFVGDGCHRLACLMSLGMTALPRSHVRVKCFRRLAPFDNTSLLRDVLPIEWPDTFTTP